MDGLPAGPGLPAVASPRSGEGGYGARLGEVTARPVQVLRLAGRGAGAQRVLGAGQFAAEVGGVVQAADQAGGEHAGVPVGRVAGFEDGGEQPVVAVVLDHQQPPAGVGVHDQVAGRVGDGAAGRSACWTGTARRAGVAGGALASGGQDRGDICGADQVGDLDVGAEVRKPAPRRSAIR